MSSINYLPLPHDEMAAIRKMEAKYREEQRRFATESRRKILASMPVASIPAAASVPTDASMPVALSAREKLEQLIESKEVQEIAKRMRLCLKELVQAQKEGDTIKSTHLGEELAGLQAIACKLVPAYEILLNKVNVAIAMLGEYKDPVNCNEKWINLTVSLEGFNSLSKSALIRSLRELANRISLDDLPELDHADRLLYTIYRKLGWGSELVL
jgi:hypothetical protein